MVSVDLDQSVAMSKDDPIEAIKNFDIKSDRMSSVTEQSTISKTNGSSLSRKPCEQKSVALESEGATKQSETERQHKSSNDTQSKPCRSSTMPQDKAKTQRKRGMPPKCLLKRLHSMEGRKDSLQQSLHARVKTNKGCLRSARIQAIERKQNLVQTQDELAYLLEKGDTSPSMVTAIINNIDEQLAENLENKAQEKKQDALEYLLEKDASPGSIMAIVNSVNEWLVDKLQRKPCVGMKDTMVCLVEEEDASPDTAMTNINTVDEELAGKFESKALDKKCGELDHIVKTDSVSSATDVQSKEWQGKSDELEHLPANNADIPSNVSGMEVGKFEHDDTMPCLSGGKSNVTVKELSFHHDVSNPSDSSKTADNVKKPAIPQHHFNSEPDLTMYQATPSTPTVQINSKETDMSTSIDHSKSQPAKEEVQASPTATNSPYLVINPMAHISMLKSHHPSVSCDLSGDTTINMSLSTSYSPQPVEPCSPMEAEPNVSPIATRSPILLYPNVTSSSPKGTAIATPSVSAGALSSTLKSSSLEVESSIKTTSQFLGRGGCDLVSKRQSKKSTEGSASSKTGEATYTSSVTTECLSDITDDIIPQTQLVSRSLSAPQLSLYNIFSPLIVSPRSTSAPLVNDRKLSQSLFSPQRTVLSIGSATDGSVKTANASVMHTSEFDVFPSQPTDISHTSMVSPSILTHHMSSNQPTLANNISLSKEETAVDKPRVLEREDAGNYAPPISSSDETTHPLDLPGNDEHEAARNRHNDKPQNIGKYWTETSEQTTSRQNLETQSVPPFVSELQKKEEKQDTSVLDLDTQSVETTNNENAVGVIGESSIALDKAAVLSEAPTGSPQPHSSLEDTTKVLTTARLFREPSPNMESRQTLTGSIPSAEHGGIHSTDHSGLTQDLQLDLTLAEEILNTFTSSMSEFQESYLVKVQRQLDKRTKQLAEVEELLREESGNEKIWESIIYPTKADSKIEHESESEMNELSPLSPSLSPSPPPGPPRLSVSEVLSSIGPCKWSRKPSESGNSSWPGNSCEQRGNPTTDESQSIFAGLRTGRSSSLEPHAKRPNLEFDERRFGADVVIPSVSLKNQANERVDVSGKVNERVCEGNGKTMSFITSGLTRNQISKVKELAMKYGIPLASCFTRNTTHVICKTDENRMATRTVKFLLGVTAGKWVVDYHWVEDCLKQSQLLPEDYYEVAGDTGSKSQGGPKAARLRSQQEVCTRKC
jgi:hypothetical protein